MRWHIHGGLQCWVVEGFFLSPFLLFLISLRFALTQPYLKGVLLFDLYFNYSHHSLNYSLFVLIFFFCIFLFSLIHWRNSKVSSYFLFILNYSSHSFNYSFFISSSFFYFYFSIRFINWHRRFTMLTRIGSGLWNYFNFIYFIFM
jgi:hypothetical protein